MHDIVIRNGTIYDGEGGSPYAADVAIDGDLIAAVMPAIGDRGRREIDASGLAIAPGFINVLSWAIPSLIADGRAPSDVHQGVTLEVFGEGSSMGPLTDAMRRDQIERQGDIKYDMPWTTLREGLDHRARRGGGRGARAGVGADLHAGHVRVDPRARRAREGRGRHVHLASAQRRGPSARGGRRAHRDRTDGWRPRRDLSPEASGQSELAEAPRGDRTRREGAGRRSRHHRGHVPVRRGCDGSQRVDAA